MNKKHELTVWGIGTTRTLRVHWMLHELGLVYKTHRIRSRSGETQSDTYKNINPKQKIPTLVDVTDEEIVITESTAIMKYLRRITNLMPYDDYQQTLIGLAAYDEWLSFILMELDATSLYVVRRHKDLPEIYGEADNAVRSSIEYFERMITSVEDKVQGKQFLWGSTFSELDIHLTICLDWAGFVGAKVPQCLSAYHDSMKQRPAYKAAYKFNFSDPPTPAIRP